MDQNITETATLKRVQVTDAERVLAPAAYIIVLSGAVMGILYGIMYMGRVCFRKFRVYLDEDSIGDEEATDDIGPPAQFETGVSDLLEQNPGDLVEYAIIDDQDLSSEPSSRLHCLKGWKANCTGNPYRPTNLWYSWKDVTVPNFDKLRRDKRQSNE